MYQVALLLIISFLDDEGSGDQMNPLMTPWPRPQIIYHTCLFTLCISLQYDGASPGYEKVLNYLNNAFTFVFMLEAILKLIAFRQVRMAHLKPSSVAFCFSKENSG